MSSSEEEEAYYSDHIDSDIEVRLYGAIHHRSDAVNSPSVNWLNSERLVCVGGVTTSDRNTSSGCVTPKSQNPNPDHSLVSSRSSTRSKHLPRFLEEIEMNSSRSNSNSKRNIELIQLDSSSSSDFSSNSSDEQSESESSSESSDSSVVVISDDEDDDDGDNNSRPSNANFRLINVNNEFRLEKIEKSANLSEASELEEVLSQMSNDKRLWRIDPVAECQKRSSNRYYSRLYCLNCKDRGHSKQDCPKPRKRPVCHVCGLPGHIKGKKCKAKICYNCDGSNHRMSFCTFDAKNKLCSICHERGHHQAQCTDFWRKFHSTTSPIVGLPVDNKTPNSRKFCYNCAKNHFGFNCQEKNIRNAFPQSPLLMSTQTNNQLNERRSNSNQIIASQDKIKCNGSSASPNPLRGFGPKLNKHIKWSYDNEEACQTVTQENHQNLAKIHPKSLFGRSKLAFQNIKKNKRIDFEKLTHQNDDDDDGMDDETIKRMLIRERRRQKKQKKKQKQQSKERMKMKRKARRKLVKERKKLEGGIRLNIQ